MPRRKILRNIQINSYQFTIITFCMNECFFLDNLKLMRKIKVIRPIEHIMIKIYILQRIFLIWHLMQFEVWSVGLILPDDVSLFFIRTEKPQLRIPYPTSSTILISTSHRFLKNYKMGNFDVKMLRF